MSVRNFRIDVNEVVSFVFPTTLQHPLAAGRLYAFGDCGPLDECGNLRSGFKGSHVVADYELEEMCLQYEREDIIQIYMHKPGMLGSLSVAEEEMIIGQADGHLKHAKGKALLPPITREDVHALFESLPRDECGKISFHDAQRMIAEFRSSRIRNFKLVYPVVSSTVSSKTPKADLRPTSLRNRGRVSEAVAPATMFQKNRGSTNSDLIEQTTRLLSKHAYRIGDGTAPATDLCANVRLLRESV